MNLRKTLVARQDPHGKIYRALQRLCSAEKLEVVYEATLAANEARDALAAVPPLKQVPDAGPPPWDPPTGDHAWKKYVR